MFYINLWYQNIFATDLYLLLMYHCYLYSISKMFLKKSCISLLVLLNIIFFCFINKSPTVCIVSCPRQLCSLLWQAQQSPSLSDWSAYVIPRDIVVTLDHIRNERLNDTQSLCSWYCLWTDSLVLNCHLYINTKRSFELLFVLFSIMSKSAQM